MRHVLALVQPLRADGTRVDVRATSADLPHFTGLGGFDWEPAISGGVRVSQRVFGGDFSERGASASSANLSLAMQVIKETYPDASELDWSGASVTLYQGQEGDAWPLAAFFKGVVRSYRGERNTLTLTCAVDTEPFEADLPSASYAGTTGAEGGADLEGTVKPLVLGHAQNVEPVAIDLIDNVYQFSAYGPIEAVTTLYERGSSFGASVGDFANYAALVAADIDEGRWGTCLAEGLIRLGAPAFGVITGDVRGHEVSGVTPRLPGAMIAALADLAGVSASLIEGGTLTALDADKPYPMSLVLTEARDFLSIAREIGAACNHIVGVGLTGQLFAQKIGIGASADITLDAQGKAWPQVISSQEESTSPPYSKVMLGAAPSWRVHTTDEIAFQAEIVDRGAYDGDAWYREGNISETANGARWIYINTEPGSGNAPPTWPTTSNAHWRSLNGPPQVSFTDLIDDGTKPDPKATRNPGATGGANLVRFVEGQDLIDDWNNTIGLSTSVPPGAPAGARSVTILDGGHQGAPFYSGSPAGKRFRVFGPIETLGHTGGDVAVVIRDGAGALYPQTVVSGTRNVAQGQAWTYVDAIIEVQSGGGQTYTEYTPGFDLTANAGDPPKFYGLRVEEVPVRTLGELDPAQDGKLNSVESNATEGATWNNNIGGQPANLAGLDPLQNTKLNAIPGNADNTAENIAPGVGGLGTAAFEDVGDLPSGSNSGFDGASGSNGFGTGGWVQVLRLTLNNVPAGRLRFNSFGLGGQNQCVPSSVSGNETFFEARFRLVDGGSTLLFRNRGPRRMIENGGTIPFGANFNDLFTDPVTISTGGTVTLDIEVQRTSGSGSVLSSTTSMDVTIEPDFS